MFVPATVPRNIAIKPAAVLDDRSVFVVQRTKIFEVAELGVIVAVKLLVTKDVDVVETSVAWVAVTTCNTFPPAATAASTKAVVANVPVPDGNASTPSPAIAAATTSVVPLVDPRNLIALIQYSKLTR